MNWQQQWINTVLAEIPTGSYRGRMEAELRDHLDSQCRTLMEAGWTPDQAQAETLRTMGEPETLRKAYRAAWRRSRSARAGDLCCRMKAWAGGWAVMGGVHLLSAYILSAMWDMATSLPWNSHDKWVRLIRGTLRGIIGDMSKSYRSWYLPWWLPLVLALAAGAFYLGRKFKTSSHPAPLISAGLCLHWACIAAINGWWYAALRPRRPFWEAVECHFALMARHYCWTFALCILLGVVIGHIAAKTRRISTRPPGTPAFTTTSWT